MATYKVIQDIEAEDKFVGPLTLKQFVFGASGLFFGWLNLIALTRGFAYAMIIFIPPMLLGIFLAVPWSKDQPTEVWVLAKLRFYFKPRRRIWDQSGMEELVTITAPKKEEKQLVDNLSKTEVKSRLRILADTIDSRGWAIKDEQLKNIVTPDDSVDRLISPSTLPKEVPIVDLATIPDVYEDTTQTSENFERMMKQSKDMHRNQSLETMDKVRGGESIESTETPSVQFTPPPTTYQTFMQAQVAEQNEKALADELKSHKTSNPATSHMRTIKPIDPNAIIDPLNAVKTEEKPVKSAPDPDILKYASNNDLNVATIARQAKKDTQGDDGEVVISLH